MDLEAFPAVSRRHCLLVVDGSGVLVKDIGSTNGVWVNERRLRGLAQLRGGDTIQLGGARFVLSWAGSGPQPDPPERSHFNSGLAPKVFVGPDEEELSSETVVDQNHQALAVS